MMHSGDRAVRRAWLSVSISACLLGLTACSHMPWSKGPAAAPQAVNELEILDAGAVAYPQYWKRNTLVIDLQSASGTGFITIKPRETGWPRRIAFRVMPGSVGLLEVQADQRMLMPVTREGTKPVDLELVPGVYTPQTPQITVRWEPAKAPAS